MEEVDDRIVSNIMGKSANNTKSLPIYTQNPVWRGNLGFYPIQPAGFNDSIANEKAYNVYSEMTPVNQKKIQFNVLRDDRF